MNEFERTAGRLGVFVPQETIEERVNGILPGNKYFNIERAPDEVDKESGQRFGFIVNFGTPTGPKRFVKADKPPKGKNSTILADKGYGTKSDVEALSMFDPEEALANSISPLLDAYVEDGLVVSAEPLYEGSVSLNRYLDKNGPLNPRQFRQIFGPGGVLKAAKKIDEKGLFFRDWNWKNILVRGENGESPSKGKDLESRVTDMGLAVRKDSVEDSVANTCNTGPGRFGRDPYLDKVFVGDDVMRHGEQAEAYAFAMSMISARLGGPPVSYNFEKRSAQAAHSDKKLLNEDGSLNIENHDAVMAEAIDKEFSFNPRSVDSWVNPGKLLLHRLAEPLKKATSANPDRRYSSFEAFLSDLDNAFDRPIYDLISASPGAFFLGGMTTALVAIGLGAWAVDYTKKNSENEKIVEVRKAERYPVVAEFDGGDLAVRNNLFDLNIRAHNSSRIVQGSDFERFPEDLSYLVASPGEKIWLTTALEYNPVPEREELKQQYTSFSMRAYIEGVPMDEENSEMFAVIPYPADKSSLREMMVRPVGYGYDSSIITIPDGLPDGVYTLAVEAYAPENEKVPEREVHVSYSSISEESWDPEKHAPKNLLYFLNEDEVIGRQRIPIVVGEPETAVDISFLNIGGSSNNFGLVDLIESSDFRYATVSPKGDVGYFVFVPGENYAVMGRKTYGGFSLPLGDDTSTRTLQIGTLDSEGEIIGYSAFAIRRENIVEDSDMEPIYWWRAALPEEGFADRLPELREEFERRLETYREETSR